METPLLQTINLKKHFKTSKGMLHAVDGVDIEISKGKTLGIVGESGCGKSTLGRTILQLEKPTSGKIMFEGKDVTNLKSKDLLALRRDMQIIFQDPFSSLNPRMSVYELIAEPLIRNKVFKNKNEQYERVLSLMKTVGLAERFVDIYPHEMDGGRRQRVGIARALALKPRFIVCDEPVSALDVSIQAQIINLLMDLQDKMNLTYIFITHDLSVVRHISDEIAVMYLGQCVERAPAKALFANPLHPYTRALLAAIPRPQLDEKQQLQVIRGEVSDPINPKPGCRFASRCEHCREECKNADVPLLDRGNGHYVACCLYQ